MFGKKPKNFGIPMSQEQKEKIRKNAKVLCGDANLMFGKTDYYWWVKKFGKEEADRKELDRKKKLSISMSGENNPMYGKPSPQGSGNGWSGWYNGWFFRSLRELSYMIKEIEKFNLKWESGEQKRYKIPYVDWNGKHRNYFCDFVIGKRLIECKPKKLHNAPSVLLKRKGALKFCKQHGLKYELASPEILTNEEIMALYKKRKIKFLKRYENKFRERYIK